MYIARFCILIHMLGGIQIYQFIRFGSTLFIFWALSRIFSIEQIGITEKNLLIANFVTFFWLQAIQTHFLKKNTYSYNHYASFILLISTFASVSILLCSFWNRMYIFSGLYVLFYPFGTLLEMYWIGQAKNKSLIQYSIFFYGTWMIVITLTAYLSHSLWTVYGAWIGILVIRMIFCVIYIPFHFVKLRRSFFNSLSWLMLTFLVAGSAEYIDGFLVDFFFNKEILAQFRYGAREIPIFIIMANSLSLWITQSIAHSKKEKLNEVLHKVKHRSSQYLVFSVSISILLICISTPVYGYVYGSQYIQSSFVFDIMLLLVVSRFIFSNSILLGLGLDKIQFMITCIELFVNVLFSIIGAYFWGMYGVAMATVVAYLIEKMMLATYLYRKKQIKPTFYVSIPFVFISYLLMLSVLWVKYSYFVF